MLYLVGVSIPWCRCKAAHGFPSCNFFQPPHFWVYGFGTVAVDTSNSIRKSWCAAELGVRCAVSGMHPVKPRVPVTPDASPTRLSAPCAWPALHIFLPCLARWWERTFCSYFVILL